MIMTPLLSLVVGAALFVTQGVAQRTNAVCEPGYEWAFNSLGQSPCVMTSYLQGVCQRDFFLPAVTEHSQYIGPSSLLESNPCWCSSVTFSIAQACQACQPEQLPLLEWGWWAMNCSGPDTTMGRFTEQLPLRTVIPAWAYEQTYDFNETFNVARAYAFKVINNTEFTRVPSNDPVGHATTVSAADEPVASEGTAVAVGAAKTTNWPGVIAGIVVGSVVALALILALVWWFLRCKRRAREEAAKNQRQAVFSIELKTHSRQNSAADSDIDSIMKIDPDKAMAI